MTLGPYRIIQVVFHHETLSSVMSAESRVFPGSGGGWGGVVLTSSRPLVASHGDIF